MYFDSARHVAHTGLGRNRGGIKATYGSIYVMSKTPAHATYLTFNK